MWCTFQKIERDYKDIICKGFCKRSNTIGDKEAELALTPVKIDLPDYCERLRLLVVTGSITIFDDPYLRHMKENKFILTRKEPIIRVDLHVRLRIVSSLVKIYSSSKTQFTPWQGRRFLLVF